MARRLVALWALDLLALALIAAYAHTPPTLRLWRRPFAFSDAVSDLAALALARGLMLIVLVAALWRGRTAGRAVTGGLAPLATPLLDPVADEAAATEGAPGAAALSPSDARTRIAVRRVLLASRAWLSAQALYVLAKCLVRLVVGPPADPALRSSEPLFWAAVGGSLALGLLEHASLCRHWLDPPLRPAGANGAAGDGAAPRRTRMADVLALCAPDWPLFVQAFAGLTVAAAGESVIPYLYGEILNDIALSSDPAAFRKPMLELVLTAAVTGLATGVRGSTFTVLGARFSTRLRQRLLQSLLAAELGFFDQTKTGEISSRLSADCQKVGDQVELNVNVFVRSLLQVVLTTAAMVAINWRLGLVAFVSVPPIVVASRVFGSFIRELTKDYQKALADSTAVAEEALGAMRTVRAFAAEEEVAGAYGRDMARYRSLVYKEAAAYFGYSALTFTFLPYCCACLVLYYGAQLVHQGGMRPGQLVSFVFYLQALQGSFNSLASIYTGLTQAVGAADKVFEWIERKPRLRPRGSVRKGDATPARGLVELRDVHFAYPTRPGSQVLRGVSLRAEPGEVLALCGSSGGGKSSILALVQRWYDCDAPGGGGGGGGVFLDGRDVREYDSRWFHHNLSVVSQEPTLFSRTIRENVLLGLQPPQPAGARARAGGGAGGASAGGSASSGGADGAWMQAEVEQACREANAHSFILSFPKGYDTEVGERGVQLSGGQKQRIAIARALVRRPRVLLLDEATSALDSESEALVQAAIDQMIDRSGGQMTVLVIAHRLSTIRNASRIAVISGGVVAEVGTHEQLLSRPNGAYATLVRMQLGGSSAGRVGSRAEGLAEMGAPAEPASARAGTGGDGGEWAAPAADAPAADPPADERVPMVAAPAQAARGCNQQ